MTPTRRVGPTVTDAVGAPHRRHADPATLRLV